MTKTHLLDRLRLKTPVPRRTSLSAEKCDIGWVVRDGPMPIAVVVRDIGTGGALLEVLQFNPNSAALPLKFPAYQHHYGTRIGYGATFNWSVGSMFQAPDEGSLDLVEQDPARLVFIHSGRYNDGSRMSCRLQITYDESFGQYAYDLGWEIDSALDTTGEFSNLFMRNLMHSDMATREYDYGCFVRDDGRWEKYPITVMVTGVQQNRLMGIPIASAGGGAGFINRSGVAPMLVHRESNVPLVCGSCNVCFDLHQTATVAKGKTARINSRFLDAGPAVAAAGDEMRLIEFDDLSACPFEPERVSDFESTISARDPWAGGIWQCDGNSTAIVADCGHSGTHSLRMQSTSGAEPISITPFMTAVTVENHTDYEMTAWVMAEGAATLEASIELRAFRYVPTDAVASGIASVVGSRQWTPLTVRVNSGTTEFLYPLLKLNGEGKAWFDDVMVRKV